ncbi:helix-turn-helix transcriptional regulator [Streptomyces sp. NPDC048057]|uniref:helix-turn-helix domain-containing protein n=1 Tax=Streptomyces sp. NPDC048057 TaxID=3155628 RepID=UPI003400A401
MVNRKTLDPRQSPRAAFGQRLRALRDERGWTQDELAAQIGCTGSHISAVETGRRPPTQHFAAIADRVLGTGDRLERQSRGVRHTALLEGFEEYVRCEARAEEVRLFEVGLIPGPLQTQEYAAAIESGHVRRGAITAEQAEERVHVLIARQEALARVLSPMVSVVLDESCIRRVVGGTDVMGRQLDRLVQFANQPNTSLQIAPYSMGERRPFNRSVNLLTQADRSVCAYVESQTQGYLDREITSVIPLVRAYHQLQTEALSQAESVSLIDQVRKGIS